VEVLHQGSTVAITGTVTSLKVVATSGATAELRHELPFERDRVLSVGSALYNPQTNRYEYKTVVEKRNIGWRVGERISMHVLFRVPNWDDSKTCSVTFQL
jgi:hypothetical protein